MLLLFAQRKSVPIILQQERDPWDVSRVLGIPDAACFSSALRTRQMGLCSPSEAGRSCVHLSPECCHARVDRWRTSGRVRASAGHGSVGTHSLEESRQGLHQAILVMCQLSAASRPQPWLQLLAPHPSWAGQSSEHCLVVSTDGLLLSFPLQWEGSAAGRGERGCPGSLLCGGAWPLPRLPEINFHMGWFKIFSSNDAPAIDHTELQLEDFIQFAQNYSTKWSAVCRNVILERSLKHLSSCELHWVLCP